MAFTVEDGTGLATANALVAVAVVDAFWADRGGDEAWDDLEPDEKEAAIVKASDYIRSNPRYQWRGQKKRAIQRMPWPRVDASERDGQPVAEDTVPWQVVDAVCGLAVRAATGDELLPDLSRGGAIQSETVGPISTTYFKNAPVGMVLQSVDGMLATLLRDGTVTDEELRIMFEVPGMPATYLESQFANPGAGLTESEASE